jgi:AraC-like DNA-binding protein
MNGELLAALRLGKERLDRPSVEEDLPKRASLGRLLGRIMLAGGREEEAEDLFKQQLKLYTAISRSTVRWYSALDQGAQLLNQNKPSRAIECFSSVADDRRAPDGVRIEAMAYAAVAMHRSGDSRSACQALDAARRIGGTVADPQIIQLLDGLSLELSVLQRWRACEGLADHALCELYREGLAAQSTEELSRLLAAATETLARTAPLAAQRMTHLLHLLECHGERPMATARVAQDLAWLRNHGLVSMEAHARIESALFLIGHGMLTTASELLHAYTFHEQHMQPNRHALDLQYCLARIRTHQGRLGDALRCYRNHSQHAVRTLRADAGHKKPAAFLEGAKEADIGEAAKQRLPLRYRRAYQYIIDNLNDDQLSVQKVATHISVTERALQMAFRAHLGLTPAELIRTRRMERIHAELCDQDGTERVLEVALRWGITNRSTLAHNYRARFDQTPTQTLQGAA